MDPATTMKPSWMKALAVSHSDFKLKRNVAVLLLEGRHRARPVPYAASRSGLGTQQAERPALHSVHWGPGLFPSTNPLSRNISWPHIELHEAQNSVIDFQPL
jgi:hypothetical protein